MILANITRRAYFRDEKPCGVRVAREFVEAKVELSVRDYERDQHALCAARDAFLERRFEECQAIAWDEGVPLHLSITGASGAVTSARAARAEARRYNESLFDDGDLSLAEMNRQWGTSYRSSRAAATHVLNHDGEYAGLDVHDEVANRVLVINACGCIHDEIARAHSSLRALIPWHLADHKQGTPAQESELQSETTRRGRDRGFYWRATEDKTAYLESVGLLYSDEDGGALISGKRAPLRGYKYGSATLALKIPSEILEIVLSLREQDEHNELERRYA